MTDATHDFTRAMPWWPWTDPACDQCGVHRSKHSVTRETTWSPTKKYAVGDHVVFSDGASYPIKDVSSGLWQPWATPIGTTEDLPERVGSSPFGAPVPTDAGLSWRLPFDPPVAEVHTHSDSHAPDALKSMSDTASSFLNSASDRAAGALDAASEALSHPGETHTGGGGGSGGFDGGNPSPAPSDYSSGSTSSASDYSSAPTDYGSPSPPSDPGSSY